jgi:hypothetical protein
MVKLTAVREFNEYGYNWYPQIWVETLNQWVAVEWVRCKIPQGFTNAREAIHYTQEGM